MLTSVMMLLQIHWLPEHLWTKVVEHYKGGLYASGIYCSNWKGVMEFMVLSFQGSNTHDDNHIGILTI